MRKLLLILILMFSISLMLCSCDHKTTTTCYWCGKEETCYMYTLQYVDGYNPNGSFKYGYLTKYMSDKCANEARNSAKYTNVTKNK